MADEANDESPLLGRQGRGSFEVAGPDVQAHLNGYGNGGMATGGRPSGGRAHMSAPLPAVSVPVGMRHRNTPKSEPLPDPRRHVAPDAVEQAFVQGHSYLSGVGFRGVDPAKKQKGASFFQAAVNTTKLVVGVGSFALPQAFKLSGMVGGIIGIPLLGVWAAFAMKLMVDVRKDLGPGARYFDCGRATFGKPMEVVMYACAIFASIGACAGYIDFMAPLLVDISGVATATHAQVVAVASPVFVVLCWIRSFRYLAFTSILGDVAFVLAMVVVFAWGFSNLGAPEFDRPALEVSTFPDFLGAAVFLYGICLFVMPVQSGMEDPEQFMPSVYASFTFTTILNLIFGAVGYALWGPTAKSVIIYNLSGGFFPMAAKVLLTLDLTFSFPIVMSPARELSERFLLGEHKVDTWTRTWQRNGIRAALVAFAGLLAVGVSSFISMVGLVSGLSLIATALVFPPMCYWQRFSSQLSVPFKALLLVLIVVGTAGAVFTTYLAAQKVTL